MKDGMQGCKLGFCPHCWLDGENLGYRSMEMGGAQVPESLCGSLSIKQLQRIVRRTRNILVLSLGLGVSVIALNLSVLSVPSHV